MELVEYLYSRSEIVLDLSHGEYCNGETAMAAAVHLVRDYDIEDNSQMDMLIMLLRLGGPVDEVESDLRERVEQSLSDEPISVSVQLADDEPRKSVRLALDSDSSGDGVALEYSCRALRSIVRSLKFRRHDAALLAADPKGRPLAS